MSKKSHQDKWKFSFTRLYASIFSLKWSNFFHENEKFLWTISCETIPRQRKLYSKRLKVLIKSIYETRKIYIKRIFFRLYMKVVYTKTVNVDVALFFHIFFIKLLSYWVEHGTSFKVMSICLKCQPLFTKIMQTEQYVIWHSYIL